MNDDDDIDNWGNSGNDRGGEPNDNDNTSRGGELNPGGESNPRGEERSKVDEENEEGRGGGGR